MTVIFSCKPDISSVSAVAFSDLYLATRCICLHIVVLIKASAKLHKHMLHSVQRSKHLCGKIVCT